MSGKSRISDGNPKAKPEARTHTILSHTITCTRHCGPRYFTWVGDGFEGRGGRWAVGLLVHYEFRPLLRFGVG
jgi:hypothetical protein